MEICLINQSKIKMPRKWMSLWLEQVGQNLKTSDSQLTVVFLDTAKAKKLNQQFRKKNYATDVLSFQGDEGRNLGELVLCPQVLKKQAKEHKHSFEAELGYMLIHGVLHLLGYEHEKSKKEAQKMFKIQDQLFDRLCSKFEI